MIVKPQVRSRKS